MRFLTPYVWIVVWTLVAFAPGPANAQETILPKEHHEWGRFDKGAWKRVRVISEMLDENGAIAGISETETTITLLNVSDEGVTLRVEETVKIAGERFDKQPRTFQQGFFGEIPTADVSVKKIRDSSLTIDGLKIPVAVLRIVAEDDTTRWTRTIQYSNRIAPYVLHQETTSLDIERDVTNYQTVAWVLSLGMPCKIKAEMKTASYVKTVYKDAKTKTITMEIRSKDVPGGVVSHASKQLDEAGKVVRRTTLELINYGLEPEKSESDEPDSSDPNGTGLRELSVSIFEIDPTQVGPVE